MPKLRKRDEADRVTEPERPGAALNDDPRIFNKTQEHEDADFTRRSVKGVCLAEQQAP